MNATTVLNDLQYLIDKKSQYLQRCCSEGKSKKALEIELATLVQAKELLENLVMQQQEAEQQLNKARASIKNAEKAFLIAEAAEAEYYSATYWGDPKYASRLLTLLTNPKVLIQQWADELKFQKSNYTVAAAVEQRLDYFNERNRETYKEWCKSVRIDYRKREHIWCQIWVNKKNSENHA